MKCTAPYDTRGDGFRFWGNTRRFGICSSLLPKNAISARKEPRWMESLEEAIGDPWTPSPPDVRQLQFPHRGQGHDLPSVRQCTICRKSVVQSFRSRTGSLGIIRSKEKEDMRTFGKEIFWRS